MKWYFVNYWSPLGRSPDSCVYWDVQLVSAYKFLAKFYIYLPPRYLCTFKVVRAHCTLLGYRSSKAKIGKAFIECDRKGFGYEDGDWWLLEYQFCLNKDLVNVINSYSSDVSSINDNCMELHLKLSNQRYRFAQWKNSVDVNCVYRIRDVQNQLLKYRINFLPNDVKTVFRKDFMLCHIMQRTIVQCIRELLSLCENGDYTHNFDWLKILFEYIRLDDDEYFYYSYSYKYINIYDDITEPRVPSQHKKRKKRKKRINNNNTNNSNKNVDTEWNDNYNNNPDSNSDLYDCTQICNSKYSKNCYKSSKIKQKYREKKATNRQHQIKKMCKNKRKHNFPKKIARNKKYEQYESTIEQEIDDFYDLFHLDCSGCHLCYLSYDECPCLRCAQERRGKMLVEMRMEREWERKVRQAYKEQAKYEREQEWQLEMEWLEWYWIMEDDYIFENITDAAFNVYLNEKYGHNCYKSLIITKNIAKKRKNNSKIKIKKIEKMKKKKYFIKNTNKSKYRTKYPTKLNHFDF